MKTSRIHGHTVIHVPRYFPMVHLPTNQNPVYQKHHNDLYHYDDMRPLKMSIHTCREKNGMHQSDAIRLHGGGFEMMKPLYLNHKDL